MNFIGNKVYMLWKEYIFFGTIIDTKFKKGDWRYFKVSFSNGEVYQRSMAHNDPEFDLSNHWIRTDKIHSMNQREMIQMIKDA
jgi:hypothetical protein